MKPTLANVHECTGCSACVDSCSKRALTTYMASDGHIYISCNENKCVLCHKCEKVCPVINGIEYSSNIKTVSHPYSAYCTSDYIYKKSTSGGVFAALASQFVNDGGYVCGAIIENNCVKHIVSNKLDDIKKMQGSKYLQSSLNDVYRKIDELLKQGFKVLFCGMGCQGAAMYSFFRKHQNRDLLYIIDMICGGVPTSYLANSFLDNESNYKQIVGFRRKGDYVLSCLNRNEEIVYLEHKTLPICGFWTGVTNRYSCGDCQFCGIERLSDITIGDLWGPLSKGCIHKSVAIVHSVKGEDLLNSTRLLSVSQIDWSFVLYNYRCVIGKTYKRFCLQRKLLAWNFKHLSYNQLCGLYGCSSNNPLWLFVKVYNKLLSICDKYIIRKQLNKIIKSLNHAE